MSRQPTRDIRLGGVLTSPQAAPSGLQMTPPSHPGTENPRKPGSPDFILIVMLGSQPKPANQLDYRLYYLLGKGGYVFGSVGLSVCLWTTLLKKLQTDWDEILWRGPG